MTQRMSPAAVTTLARQRAEYVAALDRAVDLITAGLAPLPEVELVVLFGSYAGGRRDLFTDLDLLVVMRTEEEFVHRSAALRRAIPVGVDLDVLVYTPEEFARLSDHGFVRHALATGRVLYAKDAAPGS